MKLKGASFALQDQVGWYGCFFPQEGGRSKGKRAVTPEGRHTGRCARQSSVIVERIKLRRRGGGNMIALVEKENTPAVAEALLLGAGARRVIVTTVG